jgi:FKBP12-rapamycin complex-associated protein
LFSNSELYRATLNVLEALVAFGPSLEAWLFLILPPIMRLCEKLDSEEVRICAVQTISKLCKSGLNLREYISRIIHPMVRVIETASAPLQQEVVSTLCVLLVQMGTEYAIFIPMVDKVTIVFQKHNGWGIDNIFLTGNKRLRF